MQIDTISNNPVRPLQIHNHRPMLLPIHPPSDFATKQEASTNAVVIPPPPPPPSPGIMSKHSSRSTPTTTPTWSRLKDPRIVCMSRAFGGKDRHSKVCTVRGIRDRRVRLSVPTAIQLYDLQERLGLNQPSKVVDWLLNAAKHGIDELPPLEIPDGCFAQMINSHCPRENPNCGDSAWNDSKNSIFNPGVDLGKIGSDKHVEPCFQIPGLENASDSRDAACFQVPGIESNSVSREMACFQVPGLYNSILRFNPPNLTEQPDHDVQNFGMPTSVIVCQPEMSTQPCFQPSQIIPATENTEFVPKPSNVLGFSPEVSNSSLIPSLVHYFGIQSALRTVPFDTTENLPTLKKDEQNMKNEVNA